MNVDYIVQIPNSNPIRFTRQGVTNNQRANFDQIMFSEAKNAGQRKRTYKQFLENADPLRPQFFSNFPLNRLRILDFEGEQVVSHSPAVTLAYRNKKFRSSCKFSSVNGKLFIYFDEEYEYADEDFTVQGDLVTLDGRLPNYRILAGDVIRYQIQDFDFASTVIGSIVWNSDLQAEGLLTDVDITLLSVASGLIEITYNEKEADLFAQALDLSGLDEGIYYVQLSCGITDYLVNFISEPLSIKELHEKTLAIDYSHTGEFDSEDAWGYVYLDGYFNRKRVPANHHHLVTGGEIEIHNDDAGIAEKTRAVPYRQVIFKAFDLPSWEVDKLNLIFAHNHLIINEYEWVNEDFGTFNIIAKTDIGQFEITLRQKDDRISTTTTITVDVTAEFDPDTIEDVVFAGDVIEVVFSSNSGQIFSWLNLPDWIESDLEEFEDGDTITLTILENAGAIGRSIDLTAICDTEGLTPEIAINQLFDDTVPLYIDVAEIFQDLIFSATADQTILIPVSSSGDYDITVTGHAFDVVKESGFTQIRISEDTANVGPGNREAVVKLALQADPLVFVEINVTQEAAAITGIEVDPSEIEFGIDGGSELVTVDADPSIDWQAVPSESWIVCDSSIQSGDVLVLVTVNPGGAAIGNVTFVNINDPTDFAYLSVIRTGESQD
jgi:hypothetical protein